MNNYLSTQNGFSPENKPAHCLEQINIGNRNGRATEDEKARGGKLPTEDISNIGDLLNTAFFSTEIDAEKLQQSISDRSDAKNRTIDKRIAAVAIVLVLMIFIVDLIAHYI